MVNVFELRHLKFAHYLQKGTCILPLAVDVHVHEVTIYLVSQNQNFSALLS